MIISLSRWKGDPRNLGLAREIAPVLKRHGAVFVRAGTCHAGADAGQIFVAIGYPDWAAYGRSLHAVTQDADYQRIYAEANKTFELQERSLLVAEDL